MPLNVMDAHFRSFQHQVLPVLVKEGIGVLGMKPMGSGHILQSHAVQPVECLHYALNLPTSTVITGIDRLEILTQALQAARTFKPMSPKTVAALLARTADARPAPASSSPSRPPRISTARAITRNGWVSGCSRGHGCRDGFMPDEKAKARRGCLFYGGIAAAVLLVAILVAGLVWTGWPSGSSTSSQTPSPCPCRQSGYLRPK